MKGMLALVLMVILAVLPSTAFAGIGKADHTLIDYTSAGSWPAPPPTDAPGIFAMELNSGAVIFDKGGDDIHYPASTTKTMTALLALENCELDEEVTFSSKAINDIEAGGHHFEFQEGEVLTVDECLQFLLVESVNECAYALAEHVAGSMDAFVNMMNAKAVELGATNTHFNNAHGLNDENHVTTAHDMAMILWGCIQDPRFQQYADIQSISLRGRAIRTSGFTSYDNHHEMLIYNNKHYDPDVVCGKTGFTSIAGSTLVTYGHRNDMDVIVVIMQGEDQLRFEDTRAVLDYAFDNFELVSAQELNKELLTAKGSGIDLGETIDPEDILLLPKNRKEGSLTSEFLPRSETETDMEVLGTRNWYYDGVPAGTSVITLGSRDRSLYVEGEAVDEGVTVSKGKPGSSAKKVLFGLTKKELILFAVLAIVLIVLVLVLILLIRRNRKDKEIGTDIGRREVAKTRKKENKADTADESDSEDKTTPEKDTEKESPEEGTENLSAKEAENTSAGDPDDDFAIDVMDLSDMSENPGSEGEKTTLAESAESAVSGLKNAVADLKDSKVAEEAVVLKDKMVKVLKSTKKGVTKVAEVSVASVEKAKDIWAAMDQEQPPLEPQTSRRVKERASEKEAAAPRRTRPAESARKESVSGTASAVRPASTARTASTARPKAASRPATATRPAAVPRTEALVRPAAPRTVAPKTAAPKAAAPKAADPKPVAAKSEDAILQLDDDLALAFEEVPTGQIGKHKTYRMTLKRTDSGQE